MLLNHAWQCLMQKKDGCRKQKTGHLLKKNGRRALYPAFLKNGRRAFTWVFLKNLRLFD